MSPQLKELKLDCVKLLLPWNVNDAEKVLYCQRIGTVVSEAAKWQMPVMVEPAPRVKMGAKRSVLPAASGKAPVEKPPASIEKMPPEAKAMVKVPEVEVTSLVNV